jgi:hypothetical protein
MHLMRWLIGCSLVLLCVPVQASPAEAQAGAAKTQTATQWYLEYRKAFDKAKTFDELFPYMSASSRKEAEAHTPADRAKQFGLIKMLGTVTGIKVTKEQVTPAGATLTVEGIDSMAKSKTTGKITPARDGLRQDRLRSTPA